jgi:hypothetical protein
LGDLAIFGVASGRLRSTLENQVTALAAIREETLNVSDLRRLLAAETGIVSSTGTSGLSQVPGGIELEHTSHSPIRDPTIFRSGYLYIYPISPIRTVGSQVRAAPPDAHSKAQSVSWERDSRGERDVGFPLIPRYIRFGSTSTAPSTHKFVVEPRKLSWLFRHQAPEHHQIG